MGLINKDNYGEEKNNLVAIMICNVICWEFKTQGVGMVYLCVRKDYAWSVGRRVLKIEDI
jgi:hypothetical protein